MPATKNNFKLYLVSYAALHTPGSSSIAGSGWVEVGNFSEEACKKYAANLKMVHHGGIGADSAYSVAAVYIQVA